MPLKAIKDALKMDDDTLQKNIKSLMLKNFKLLEVREQSITQQMEQATGPRQTPTMQLRDDTIIGVNEAFSSPYNRIVFPTPVLEEVYKKEVVQEDRSIAVEAAIVRIMKSRKKLDHNSLVQEVLNALRMFQPNPQ